MEIHLYLISYYKWKTENDSPVNGNAYSQNHSDIYTETKLFGLRRPGASCTAIYWEGAPLMPHASTALSAILYL